MIKTGIYQTTIYTHNEALWLLKEVLIFLKIVTILKQLLFFLPLLLLETLLFFFLLFEALLLLLHSLFFFCAFLLTLFNLLFEKRFLTFGLLLLFNAFIFLILVDEQPRDSHRHTLKLNHRSHIVVLYQLHQIRNLNLQFIYSILEIRYVKELKKYRIWLLQQTYW